MNQRRPWWIRFRRSFWVAASVALLLLPEWIEIADAASGRRRPVVVERPAVRRQERARQREQRQQQRERQERERSERERKRQERERRERERGASSSRESRGSGESGRAELRRLEDARTIARQERLTPGEIARSVDGQGRTTVVEGWLRLQPGEAPRGRTVEGRDRGHLMARQFGGSGEAWNLTPQSARINRSYINALEGTLARRVRAGENVYLRVRPRYGRSGEVETLTYDVYRRAGGSGAPRHEFRVELNPTRDVACTLRQAVRGRVGEWYEPSVPEGVTVH